MVASRLVLPAAHGTLVVACPRVPSWAQTRRAPSLTPRTLPETPDKHEGRRSRPRCLGLGCAAAGLPGDAAAGQPLEERLERARRLSADACATETTAFSTCLADASITFTPATPAGPWASCADVQAEVTGICDAGRAACEVEYPRIRSARQYMLTSSYGASCDLTCASSTRTPAPTPADFQDLDGDGANDVAAEGDCCINGSTA